MKITKDLNVKNKNSGITLIALVITIIVMIILVAVTVNVAINGGLFGKAQTATKKTNKAMADEQSLGNGRVNIAGKEYNSPQEYVDTIIGGNSGNSGNTEGKLTLTINGESEVEVTKNIILTLKDSNGTTISENITWSSSNETAATVSNGVVNGLKAAKENEETSIGKTIITATYNGKKATKEITVKPSNGECSSCWGTGVRFMHECLYEGKLMSAHFYRKCSNGHYYWYPSPDAFDCCPECGADIVWTQDYLHTMCGDWSPEECVRGECLRCGGDGLDLIYEVVIESY